MPNWCTNKLAVYGPEEKIRQFKEQAQGYEPWLHIREQEAKTLNFHSLVPIPPEILFAGYDPVGHDWEVANWGCKWGACDATVTDEHQGSLAYAFTTAWSPPLPFPSRLAPQWPTLLFLLDYEEMGMGLKGIAKLKGAVTEHHRLSL